MNIDKLMNADYPIPDPSWDYSEIWHHSQGAATELQKLLQFMGTLENASPQSDAEIKLLLDNIGQKLNSARRLIDS